MTPSEVHADFPAEPASAGHARRFVDRTLRAWDCIALVDIAMLLVSELVSNAILHAGTSIEVALTLREGRVRAEVRDGSARAPSRKRYSKLSTTGRGLLLVEELADDWGVDTSGLGKAVWFELAGPDRRAETAGSYGGHQGVQLGGNDRFATDMGPTPLAGGGPGSDPRPRLLVRT